MPEAAEAVKEFRKLVDKSVDVADDQLQKQQIGEPVWGIIDGYRNVEANGLRIASIDKNHGRLGIFAVDSEHIWGVSPENSLHLGKYVGHIALISKIEQPSTLIRRWELATGSIMNIYTSREITESQEIEMAVSWFRSPHLETNVLEELGVLTTDEQHRVKNQMEQSKKSHAKLQNQLEAIRKAQEKGLRESRNLYLNR